MLNQFSKNRIAMNRIRESLDRVYLNRIIHLFAAELRELSVQFKMCFLSASHFKYLDTTTPVFIIFVDIHGK